MRIIFTGSRHNEDVHHTAVGEILYVLDPDIVTVVHGHCPTGYDAAVDVEAIINGFEIERHPADWDTYGKGAGPIRNKEMARLGADLCIAFNGGSGTNGMVAEAKARDIPVLRLDTA